MADSDDFEFQLQQEALASEKKDNVQDNPSIYTDKDGAQFEWDPVKRAWFPRITDDFVALYQAQYGNYVETDDDKKSSEVLPGPSTKPEQINDANSQEEESRKRKAEAEPSWFEEDDLYNTKVYVSNLPQDITEDEFVEVMKKCGFIMKDDK